MEKDLSRAVPLGGSRSHFNVVPLCAGSHGAVFEFRPLIHLSDTLLFGTPTLFARPVLYSREVQVAATLEEFVGYLTGQKPKPAASNASLRSVYTKGSVWDYENEWRILDKKRSGEERPSVLRQFNFRENSSLFTPGCRMLPEDRERIRDILAAWETPVSLFQMRDERIRYELTVEQVPI